METFDRVRIVQMMMQGLPKRILAINGTQPGPFSSPGLTDRNRFSAGITSRAVACCPSFNAEITATALARHLDVKQNRTRASKLLTPST